MLTAHFSRLFQESVCNTYEPVQYMLSFACAYIGTVGTAAVGTCAYMLHKLFTAAEIAYPDC